LIPNTTSARPALPAPGFLVVGAARNNIAIMSRQYLHLRFVRLCAFLLLAVSAAGHASDVTPVPALDLTRYAGKWHEIASIPQFFQRKCVRDTTATYSPAESSMIRVDNVCLKSDGSEERAEGRARRPDATGAPAKLEVSFVNLFGQYLFWFKGDYWVIALDPDYQWAVVGHPTRKYGWLLSRTPQLDPATLSGIVARIKYQGYDACTFLVTPQTGGLATRQPLCEVVRQP